MKKKKKWMIGIVITGVCTLCFIGAAVFFNKDRSVSAANTAAKPQSSEKFIGWNTKADGSGKWYYPNDTIQVGTLKTDMDLYAQWKKQQVGYKTINIGNGQYTVTVNFSDIPDYKNLTKDNFLVECVYIQQTDSSSGTGTFTVSKSYNPSTGILTITRSSLKGSTLFSEWHVWYGSGYKFNYVGDVDMTNVSGNETSSLVTNTPNVIPEITQWSITNYRSYKMTPTVQYHSDTGRTGFGRNGVSGDSASYKVKVYTFQPE